MHMPDTVDFRTASQLQRQEVRAQAVAALQARYRRRNLLAFWILGFLNNYYYCVVLSASESIAESYHLKSYTALVSWAAIVGGVIVRSLNAFVFNHIGYNWRISFFAIQAIIGVALVCVAPWCGHNDGFRFFLALVGISFIGNSSSYGESAMLGYLNRLPPMTLNGWSSGTGLSGVAASLVFLGLGAIPGMTNTFIFLCNVPTVLVYCWSFYWLVLPIQESALDDAMETAFGARDMVAGASTNPDEALVQRTVAAFSPSANWADASQWGKLTLRAPKPQSPDAARVYGGAASVVVADESQGPLFARETAHTLVSASTPVADRDDEALGLVNSGGGDAQNKRSCIARFFECLMPGTPLWTVKLTHHAIFFNCLNLFLVYVFEYGVQFMAPYAFPSSTKGGIEYDWATRNAFVLSQFCYQVGVLMSRSSLQFVRVRRVWILSLIQGVNFVCWVVQAKTLLLSSNDSASAQTAYTALLLAWMVGVGLMGGASYVNVFFNILNDDDPTATIERLPADGHGSAAMVLERPRFNFKELAMNIGALYATAGITGGALLDVVISNTLIK
jgi:battenin